MDECERLKTCSTCKHQKRLFEFYKQSDKRDGLSSQCKACVNARQLRNPEKRKAYRAVYEADNKAAFAARNKRYHEANREKRLAQHREWAKANAAYVQRRNQEWKNRKRKTDPLYALRARIKNNINQHLRKRGVQRYSAVPQILGCSYVEFMAHIESRFLPGMSWENRSSWHIDHHIPIASATTAEEVMALNHYTNLKPMWALDNILKGARMPQSSLLELTL